MNFLARILAFVHAYVSTVYFTCKSYNNTQYNSTVVLHVDIKCTFTVCKNYI